MKLSKRSQVYNCQKYDWVLIYLKENAFFKPLLQQIMGHVKCLDMSIPATDYHDVYQDFCAFSWTDYNEILVQQVNQH